MDIQSYSSYSDEQLIASLRNDDNLAFGAIYSRYYQDVYRYILVLVKVPELAEDLTHEVFLKIWDYRTQLKIERNFKSYLLRVSHNKAIDFHRKTATEGTFMNQLLHHYKTQTNGEYFSEADFKRFDALVEEALDFLTPQRRKVYELSRKEKKSYEEIAQELNISRNTVKAHISQALAILRDFILERAHFSLILLFIKKMF